MSLQDDARLVLEWDSSIGSIVVDGHGKSLIRNISYQPCGYEIVVNLARRPDCDGYLYVPIGEKVYVTVHGINMDLEIDTKKFASTVVECGEVLRLRLNQAVEFDVKRYN